MQMLTSSKDNSVRLWDVRTAKPLRCFKGHQNTSKNFVRARFGPGKDSVSSGSEDGVVYLWDAETAAVTQRLAGHTDVAYDVQWNEELSLLASCSHDGTVRTWCYKATMPLVCSDDLGDPWTRGTWAGAALPS